MAQASSSPIARMHSLALVCASALSLLSPLTGVISPASSAEADKISLKFDVIAHGTTVYDIGIDYSFSPGEYSAQVSAATTGLVGFFVDEQLEMRASGSLDQSSVRPARFTYRETDSDGRKSTEMRWGAANVDVDRSYDLEEERARAIEQAIDKPLPDPLSGVLNAALSSSGKPCSGTQRVYDGKEVFALNFSYLGQTQFEEKNAAYRGPAYKCQVQYKSIAGLSKKKAERNRANPPVYTVWFAPVHAAAANRDLLVPIAATGTMKGRSVRIIARKASVNGTPLAKSARAATE
ncbi:DUF3108 domain-containing protein [Rhodoligotrophos ferricapiens]|uniref:DUF3108 domain-containing protein n=1 Tax=Rhodoligotrophos ferricapiens TaxID=3069264 RepID=UPI00315C761B